MESSSQNSRCLSHDLIPVLQKFDKDNQNASDIHILKNQFKIGRARENDEVISSLVISRSHCIFHCNNNGDWSVTNLSNNGTLINGEIVNTNETKSVSLGDIVQFSSAEEFKYYFTMRFKDEVPAKRRKTDDVTQVSSRENTFSDYQEQQRKEMEEELEAKRTEQKDLKRLLEECLNRRNTDDDTLITERVDCLKTAITNSEKMEQILVGTYNYYVTEMEAESRLFNESIVEGVKRLHRKFSPSDKQIDRLISQKMEIWTRERRNKWSEIMKSMMKEERIKLEKLEAERSLLNAKLKKAEDALAITKDALREKSEYAKQLLEKHNQEAEKRKEPSSPGSKYQDGIPSTSKDTIHTTMVNILDEQLTCSICSEIFVNPTALNCSHTFCEHCISSWKKKNRMAKCPICRKKIKSMNQSRVFDALIEKIFSELSPEMRKRREQLIDERKTS